MNTEQEWYHQLDGKYIRNKERFVQSIQAALDEKKVLANRKEKAQNVGLEYLCQDVHQKQTGWYKLPCGHIKMLSNGDFHKRVFHCYGCDVVNWEQEAKKRDMEFIKKVDGQRALYRLNHCNHKVVLGTHHIRANKRRHCEECHVKELSVIASENNLEFIVKTAPRKALYRFRECGHQHELYTNHVKKGEFSCPTCNSTLKKRLNSLTKKGDFNKNLDEEQFDISMEAKKGKPESIRKWIEEAKEKGITFLCRDVQEESSGWYKLPCGHIRKIRIRNVRVCKSIENIICTECMENKRIQKAKEKGLRLIKVINGDIALYELIQCGHKREIFMVDVERHNRFVCKECTMQKWKEEANKANLNFIHKTADKKALYECKACNTKQEIHIVAVRNKEFICKGCHN